MDTIYGIEEHLKDVETTKEHKGSFCGLRNTSQIHQWASNVGVAGFLAKHFGIEKIPCYYWLLCLLKMIEPQSLNLCFTKWVQSFLPNGTKGTCYSVKDVSYETPTTRIATVLFAAHSGICAKRH